MMRNLKLIIAILMMSTINMANASDGGSRILVVWYSWSGNTETVGKYIQEMTGGDIFVIEPVDPYSSDYNQCVNEAKMEINAGRRRAIKGRVDNINSYDVIMVGTPNWWSTMAPPVLEFLTSHDLAGKTIVPFVTHGGGREARCFSDMIKAVPEARFLKGLVISGNRANNSQNDVKEWLKELSLGK